MATPVPGGFGVYVHWPFCKSKCPYCDFNSHVRTGIDQDAWRAALVMELSHAAQGLTDRRVDSVFFGGGTPSLMPAETVAAILDNIAHLFPVAEDVEITLEANPTSVEAARFAGYRAAGVNRVSLGVQALDREALTFLGREHDVAEATAAIELARRHFDRLSFDLIHARPGQTPDRWRAELRQALALAADHLSLYQLTIEPNTGFAGQVARGAWTPMDDDRQADLFELTQEVTAAHGLPAYEVSNHAAPGAESRHNLIYWRGGDWLGIGPGAHGRVTSAATGRLETRRLKKPECWLDAVTSLGHGTEATELIPPRADGMERLMMALRLVEGVDLDDQAQRAGMSVAALIDQAVLGDFIAEGLMWRKGPRIGATEMGRPLLNAMLTRLVD